MSTRPIPDRLGRLGLGAASLGNLFHEISDEQARAVVDAAWVGGVRYFDTAPHYGLGLSERRLGAALRDRPRDEYVLSTKVGRLLRPTPDRSDDLDDAGFVVPAAFERVWDPTPDGIRRSLEESRRRLGLDRIDITYLHDPEEYDLTAGLEQGLPALAALREEGAIGAIGVGSKSVDALIAAVRTGLCDVIMVAGRLTLLDQSAVPELVPLCRQHGVGIVNVGIFNSGALAADVPGPHLHYEYAAISGERLAQIQRMHDVCARFGVRLADAALQYSTQIPEIVNVTVGASSPSEINKSLTGMSAPIDPALWPALAAVRG